MCAWAFALTCATPASAETIDLVCRYSDTDIDVHVSVDTDRQSVVMTIDGTRFAPDAASISDSLIRWTERTPESERQYTIDRVAGTLSDIWIYRGEQKSDGRGQCRRATQKF